ncbi:MAG: hypothetical protein IIB17_05180, partial [Chloroflexi bacterium]|nr:hypothetical protein [Chloroflexota bacterium]
SRPRLSDFLVHAGVEPLESLDDISADETPNALKIRFPWGEWGFESLPVHHGAPALESSFG